MFRQYPVPTGLSQSIYIVYQPIPPPNPTKINWNVARYSGRRYLLIWTVLHINRSVHQWSLRHVTLHTKHNTFCARRERDVFVTFALFTQRTLLLENNSSAKLKQSIMTRRANEKCQCNYHSGTFHVFVLCQGCQVEKSLQINRK